MKKSAFWNGPLFIIIAALLWALDGVIRRGLYTFDPPVIIFFEHVLGLCLLLPFVIGRTRGVKLSKKEWGILTLVALFSGVLGTLFFTAALLKTAFISFSVVFFLQKLQPLFAIGTAHIFLKEPLHKKYVLYASLALVAAYFLTFPLGKIDFNTGSGTVAAALFAFLASLCWGSSTTFSKMLLNKHDPHVITVLRFAITTVLAFGLVLLLGHAPEIRVPTSGELWRFVVIALSTGMVALLIYYRGLKNTSVRVATILELMFPLVAVVIDIFLYDTVLHSTQYIAGGLLLLVMYQISKHNNALTI
ncbi:MAG: EamA family transporter [Candidatus Pacebacteria bacterium]|nr:EamA family transporter [Candidatus Paceibacterota bacterium]